MSSVSSSASSRIVTPTERLLAVGRIADDASGDAIRPATAAQDPDSDTPPPTDEVVITAEAAEAAIAAAEADPAALPNIDAADAAIPLAPANYNGTPASQAAYAYAQTMQAWLESKNPRPAARRAAKPNPDTER
jgi:hypothetical protein